MAVRALCSQDFLAVRASFLFWGGVGGCKRLVKMAVRALSSQYFFGCKSLISMAARAFSGTIFWGGVRVLFPFSSDLKLTC